MKLLTIAIPILLALSMAPASSAVAIGPCDDGGALNLALCVADTGESATCTIVYGGSADPDCVTNYADVTLALCDYIFGSPQCVDAETNTAFTTAGPLEDYQQCTQTGGFHEPLHCLRVLVQSTCDAVSPSVDCTLPAAESSAAFLGPCDEGGALNLAYCTAETGENAVCVIVYGGTANPQCISDRVDLTVDTIVHAVCVIVFGSSQCDKLLAVHLEA